MANSLRPPTRFFRVLIVEDDPVIASIYKRTVNAVPQLEVAAIVRRGEDAIAFLDHKPCDLMLLDLTLAGMDGMALQRRLRAGDYPIETIVLTASRNPDAVRSLARWGVIDYLVKPFAIELLRQSLGRFLHRASALNGESLDQDAIDRYCAAGRSPKRWLPKGLTKEGVDLVRASLEVNGTPSSAAEVADATGLARVTARRYLEYLVAIDQATIDSLPSGPGRPRKLYRREPELTVGSAATT